MYSQTLLNTLLSQQSHLSALRQLNSGATVSPSGSFSGQPSAGVNMTQTGSNVGLQPSWSDPQVHITTATGKSTLTHYDICDFVPHVLEEEMVVGGLGDQQLVIKSGPTKPRLESLTLSQWSIANLAILYKLANEGKLLGASLMDYLSYSTKICQLVQRFSLVSIFAVR